MSFWQILGHLAVSDEGETIQRVSDTTSVSSDGNYAEVTCASPDDIFDPTGDNAAKLFRGQGLHVRYVGLEKKLRN